LATTVVYTDDECPELVRHEGGEEEIFPDPMSESLAEGWRSGAVKALERQFAALGNAEPGKS
jgi:hypothetical protein